MKGLRLQVSGLGSRAVVSWFGGGGGGAERALLQTMVPGGLVAKKRTARCVYCSVVPLLSVGITF